VAALADRKIIAAKSPLPIVTTHTTLRAGRCVMIQRLGLSYLSSLWHSRPDLVAFGASYFLMPRMTEANAESLRKFRSASIAAQLMTRAARGDVAPLRLRARRMTTIAGYVSVETGRNGQGYAATRGPMTSSAVNTLHFHVSRMVELHAEAF